MSDHIKIRFRRSVFVKGEPYEAGREAVFHKDTALPLVVGGAAVIVSLTPEAETPPAQKRRKAVKKPRERREK